MQDNSLGNPSKIAHKTWGVYVALWLDVLGHQATTSANVVPDLYRHMTSLDHNKLTFLSGIHDQERKVFCNFDLLTDTIIGSCTK